MGKTQGQVEAWGQVGRSNVEDKIAMCSQQAARHKGAQKPQQP